MNERALVIRTLIVLMVIVLSVRLFSIQVVDEKYKRIAEDNIINEIVDYPYRGLVYDRNGQLLVHNEPAFDVQIVPHEVDLEDSTTICRLLDISHEEYMTAYQKARRYSSILPSVFYQKLSNQEFAKIQDQLINLNGFSVLPRTSRAYNHESLANVLGYIGQISSRQLQRDTTGYYAGGDDIGITGIEKQYENVLRGKRGVSYKTVNVRGMIMGSFRDGEYDTVPVPGLDIQLTVDLELQRYAEFLMKDKIGSVVALDPNTGEVLAFVSSPSYDPNLLSGRKFSENYQNIARDTLNPLFQRPIQAMYPPGSMFKTILSLIAMQEKRVGPVEEIMCEGNLIGDHAPPGEYDIRKAITYSSNNFFFKVFRRIIQTGTEESPFIDSRIGFETWRNHLLNFGLGRKLGIDIPNEVSGLVPSLNTYDRVYGKNRWKFSNIYSLSIGQGELLVTPLQMANLGAILANKGFYYTPHLIKTIEDQGPVTFVKNDVGIDSIYYNEVLEGMKQVVTIGTARRAFMSDLQICGKTSTVQNPHGEDHSGFMGFAPMKKPQIAVAVYVENAGEGGRAAATIAGLLVEKYVRGEITRPWFENYVLEGDFL
ncbi:MAG: penicillin-binding protein 2 [Cyclobacteriaceae bacterium]